jgi:hypothetical protein
VPADSEIMKGKGQRVGRRRSEDQTHLLLPSFDAIEHKNEQRVLKSRFETWRRGGHGQDRHRNPERDRRNLEDGGGGK